MLRFVHTVCFATIARDLLLLQLVTVLTLHLVFYGENKAAEDMVEGRVSTESPESVLLAGKQ